MGKIVKFVIRFLRISNFSKNNKLTSLTIKKVFENIMENNKTEVNERNEQNKTLWRSVR